MCKNIFKKYESDDYKNLTIQEYECNLVKKLKDKWLKEYRNINHSDIVEKTRIDRGFEKYKNEINDFLNSCKDVKIYT